MSKRKKSVMRRFIRSIALTINILFTVALLVSYVSPLISPEKIWFLAFFGLAYPLLLIINILFVLIWLILWKRYIWISLIAILIGINQILSIVQIRFSEQNHGSENSLHVMTFNVHSLYGISSKSNLRGMRPRITDFFRNQAPDLLCIQEFYIKTSDSLRVMEDFTNAIGLESYFCKNYVDEKNSKKINALVIFSKYPIVSVGSFRLSNRYVYGIFADVVVDRDTVRVYNLHLESARFGHDDYSFYSQLKDAETEKVMLKEGSWKIFLKLRKAFPMRARQADIIERSIQSSPYPVILCGDFNDTPASYSYRILTGTLNDSYRKAGNEIFGSTFAGNFPSFRIDYVLTSDDFQVLSYKKYRNDLSDHYPLSVRVNLIK